jgi:hypothetical protein
MLFSLSICDTFPSVSIYMSQLAFFKFDLIGL